MSENQPIQINENQIKFKAWSYYGNPQIEDYPKLFEAFIKLKVPREIILTLEGTRLVIKIKRIKEALSKEFEIIDEARKELLAEFAIKNEDGTPKMVNNGYAMPEDAEEMAKLNKAYIELMNQDVIIPFDKIKTTQVVGFESVLDLEVLEGIIEIVEV